MSLKISSQIQRVKPNIYNKFYDSSCVSLHSSFVPFPCVIYDNVSRGSPLEKNPAPARAWSGRIDFLNVSFPGSLTGRALRVSLDRSVAAIRGNRRRLTILVEKGYEERDRRKRVTKWGSRERREKESKGDASSSVFAQPLMAYTRWSYMHGCHGNAVSFLT